MAMFIDFDTQQLAKSKQLDLQYLPAKIEGDGEANVDTYFNNYTMPGDPEFCTVGAGQEKLVSNSLRGYPLLGIKSKVPDGYKGIVLQETNKPLSEDTDRHIRLKGSFTEFTYWNYDKLPSNGDSYRQALQIFNVAEALSSPIDEKTLEDEIKRHLHENK